ncbi:MAG: hypothetical protein ACRDPA_32095 [Solirubrobacteraceae bacterium]
MREAEIEVYNEAQAKTIEDLFVEQKQQRRIDEIICDREPGQELYLRFRSGRVLRCWHVFADGSLSGCFVIGTDFGSIVADGFAAAD